MKKLFSTLFVVFFATSMMAQTGLTCEDPIPVDKSYAGHVDVDPEEGYAELWYSAWTYDLPMHVYFSPDSTNQVEWGPDVEIDFTCEYGVYEDHKLDSVINILKAMGVTLPVGFVCDRVVRDGKWEWDLSIDERYRDQLTEFGLTHNIQAFVKVSYYESGSISLTPDTAFQSCLDNGHYTKLGDTIDIAANDSNKMLIFPYSEWQKDSIRFVWIGEKPARVWVAEDECQFTPVDESMYVKAKYDITNDAPHKLYPADMESAIANWIGAGIYYAKVLSESPGKLVVERIPLGEIQGDAILLKHDEPVQLQANDERVFCFPKTWKSTEFVANTQYLMGMHISNTPEFEIGDANVLSVYPFSKEDNQRKLQLSKGDIANLGVSATDNYLYVRFACNKATTLTPSLWSTSSCVDETVLISSAQLFTVPVSSDIVYRMAYNDWADYDFTIDWTGRNTLSVYVASYCDFYSTDPEVLKVLTISSRGSLVVSKDMLTNWGASLESDGFLYLRLKSERQGNATFTSAKPAETDPENPEPEDVYTTITAAICFGEIYGWAGDTYAETGTYTKTFPAANGADSIVTLDLTVYPQTEATTEKVEIPFGETYDWHGVTYTESGEYTITLQDENGCDYQATLILTVLPEEKPVSPCVAASTLLEPVAQLTLNLSDAFDIYRIDYQAWLASGVNLVWTGKGALHTFVAKDCEFAVAIYHKDVVNYTEVPAEGKVILSEAILAPLAQYVDADGYLYVRFLTELEGQLTTALAE